jgi:hypothetical protein
MILILLFFFCLSFLSFVAPESIGTKLVAYKDNDHICSWNYRFDKNKNHFNLAWPDKNAVYFGMIIPFGSSNMTIQSNELFDIPTKIPRHPIASYFSIQIYTLGDMITSDYHVNDVEILSLDGLTRVDTTYNLFFEFNETKSHFALFRIYDSYVNDYWAGLQPTTYIDNIRLANCKIDYNQQNNIYTDINIGDFCNVKDKFHFIEVPPGTLTNYDANYMIACIEPNVTYNIEIEVPQLFCSMGYQQDDAHPYVNENYDMRYASLSILATTAPRPTIDSYAFLCNETTYTTQIIVNDDVPMPGLLYRQILPNPSFKYSIANAKHKCYNSYDSDNKYDVACIEKNMKHYFPKIWRE